jgi:hypothetical protein
MPGTVLSLQLRGMVPKPFEPILRQVTKNVSQNVIAKFAASQPAETGTG